MPPKMRVVQKARGKQNIKNKETNRVNNDEESPISQTGSACGSCEEICVDKPEKDEDTSIQCDFCNLWYHRGCTNFTPSIWNQLNKNENIVFSCDNCVINKSKSRDNLEAIKLLIEESQKENTKLFKGLKDEIFSQVDRVVDEKLKKYNESNEMKQEKLSKMIEEVKATEINIEEKIKTQVAMCMENKAEKDDKSNNLIIHKLPELNISKEQQQEKDKEDITKIIEITNPEFKAEFINIIKDQNNVQRLGDKKPDAVRPRPIKVVLPDQEMKHKIFKGCKNLKETNFKHISIQSDLSKEEQKRNFELRAELRERINKGESVCIYRGKIIPKSQKPEVKNQNQQNTSAKPEEKASNDQTNSNKPEEENKE